MSPSARCGGHALREALIGLSLLPRPYQKGPVSHLTSIVRTASNFRCLDSGRFDDEVGATEQSP